MPSQDITKDLEKLVRPRSNTRNTIESEISSALQQSSLDLDDSPYRARLYQLFGLIEKEFDSLYSENCALRARVAQLTQNDADSSAIPTESIIGPEQSKAMGSGRKAIHMGQKLRTALRGPPVFRDGAKFRLVRYLEGHKDGIWHVTSDSARNLAASASSDHTSRVWSLDNGQCIATYLGHTGSVNCISISSNSTNLQIEGSESSANGAGMLIATSSGDESTHIWKIPNNQAEGSSEDEDDNKEGNNWMDGDNNNRTINIDQKSEGIRVRLPIIRLTGHRAPVICCEWLSTSQQMVTASWDRTANIWDVEKGEVISILSGHESELNHCSTHSTQKLVATSSKDSTFRLWDFRETIQSVAVFQGHQDSVTSVAFTSGERIVSSSDDGSVKIWDLRNMRTALATIRLSSAANRVAVSKSYGVIAIPMDNRHVRIYDINGNRLPRMPNRRCHSRMVTCCTWLDDHPTHNLLTSGFDRLIAAWKVNVSTKDS